MEVSIPRDHFLERVLLGMQIVTVVCIFLIQPKSLDPHDWTFRAVILSSALAIVSTASHLLIPALTFCFHGHLLLVAAALAMDLYAILVIYGPLVWRA
ncbi:hypothetical protein ACJRO7_022266 [Eucalyptus globulus]|uniref:MARVEL domain-containing protein n=1 Tax=Eucalyptus globulus TaxID=34317 RepID=A0ABD3KMN9_EUCGL